MKIAFLGDIALIGKYDISKNPNVKDRLDILKDKLSQYDYVIGNLESPFTEKEKSFICKSMHLKSSTINVELLKYINVNAVSLANNHLYDFSNKGLQDTIDTLEKNNINWFGANSKSIDINFNEEKVSLSGFCCYSTNGSGYSEKRNIDGINTLTYNNIVNQLQADKENNRFSLMSFHWGDEHTNYPKYEHIELVSKITKYNDFVISGHHPHIIQGVQKINKSIVAYSLGNFLFDDCVSITGSFKLEQKPENKKTFIFEVEINDGKIINSKYHGVKDEISGFEFFDINEEIDNISYPLYDINNIEEYEEKRKEQINKAIREKFGDRNLKWLYSRLNYYSIGAFIATKFRSKKYLIEKERFLNRS